MLQQEGHRQVVHCLSCPVLFLPFFFQACLFQHTHNSGTFSCLRMRIYANVVCAKVGVGNGGGGVVRRLRRYAMRVPMQPDACSAKSPCPACPIQQCTKRQRK